MALLPWSCLSSLVGTVLGVFFGLDWFEAMSDFRKTLPAMDSGGEATRDQVRGMRGWVGNRMNM